MRFVIAIAAFLIAAIMIGVGVAQRTIWAPAASVTATADVRSSAPYIVISGATLNANEGQQTLRVTGASDPFVAYGRAADVKAWIGDEPFTRLSYDADSQSLKSTLVRPGDKDGAGSTGDATSTPTPSSTPTASATPKPTASAQASDAAESLDPEAPNPTGSDLWLEQFTGSKAAHTTMNVPDSVSVIIATDGAHAAPDQVSLTWPMDTRTPWAGPLIVLGGLLAIAGIVFYILALRHMRRGRGPRRGGSNGRPQRLPRAPRAARVRSVGPAATDTHGRRSLGRGLIAVPVVLAGALTMAGCSSDYWPAIGHSSTPTPTSSPIATQLPGEGSDHPAPAVTEPQLRNIVTRIAETAKTADANRDPKLAATRFTGAALTERTTNYKIRQKLSSYTGSAPIPVNPKLSIVLPQATATWPRAVDVIVSDPASKNAAPIALTLTQESPRDNYKVAYSMYMLAGAKIPNLAPADIGATAVPPDSKLLKVPTSQIAQDYASVIALGAKSGSNDEFDQTPNALIKNFGAQSKADALKKFQKTAAKLSFADRPGAGQPVSLATNNAGALVATEIEEVQTARSTDPMGSVSTPGKGATAALLGKTSTHKGFEATYSFQLLMYVPPAESKEKVRVLGYTAALVKAVELK